MDSPVWVSAVDLSSILFALGLPLLVAIYFPSRRPTWLLAVLISVAMGWAVLTFANMLIFDHAWRLYSAAGQAGTKPPMWAEAWVDDQGGNAAAGCCGWFPGFIAASAVATYRRLTRRPQGVRGFDVN